ncbi:probable potassium transporter 17 isoform X2 [Tripterygium wilfordii]|uniref:probable potassium transporter 17 isoform X2 n=1 Tax=Tripterygium wilfordii TaxID=458696 RepID=UPI0018F8440C|nr:probable potassium transporter 17 isoform X2 [Tripterygium wilfordii]
MEGRIGVAESSATLSELVVDSGLNRHPSLIHNRNGTISTTTTQCKENGRWGNVVLAYKTLGVVFGGLVTSPLYVYPSMPLKSPTEDDYLGIYSIMFWTLTLIGVVKYVGIALKADDQGEALVEAFSSIVLVVIFLMQKFGTSRVSFLFSPIMLAWTLSTPVVGIYNITRHYPSIFKALSPLYIIHFFGRNGKEGWLLLGGTVLCITGSEALFADLGHFNKSSIQMAFLFTIYPSLVLTYAGQTAYLIQNLNDHDDGFYKFIPGKVYWPMFVIATLAAIVASQSLISATFSVIKQSVVLDYFPRVMVVHTSTRKEGEVYSPEVNYILMVLCVAVILIFGDGKDIGNAFGVVVILVMLITTILLTLVMIIIWRTPLLVVSLYFTVFFTMEGIYMSVVFTKIPEGGWIPFAISFILAFIMFGWFYGRQRKIEYELTHKIDLGRLGLLLSDPCVQRVPGLCFFYTNIQDGLTPILGHYLKSMKSLHKVTIFTTLRYLLVPKVAQHERLVVNKLGLEGVYGCVIQYGYADSLNLEGDDFVTQVSDSLRIHLQNCSGEFQNDSRELQEEIYALQEAKIAGVVHIRGKTRFYIGSNCTWFDRMMLAFYEFLHSNCRSGLPALGVPPPQRIEVGMLYEA